MRRIIRNSAMVLPAILVAAFLVRAWGVRSGVPFAVGIDEPAILDRALRILNTGDWNTHIFDYPTLVIYVHALAAIVLFLGGAVVGAWTSLATFDITAAYLTARLLTALAGAATVWLTYLIAEGLGGRTLGLVAAAELAVLPMHVRESHFALTDVPVTALTTLAVWLSMRAAVTRTAHAYAAAGIACGLAAGAKYNGVVACIAPAAVWLTYEWSASDRVKKGAAAALCALAAFIAASPYAVLDMPAFLSGFAAQASRLAGHRGGVEAPWLLYLKHMALMGRLWLPAAAAGLALVLWRRSMRLRAVPLIAFGAAYFYTLATHGIVFARYALPLLPVICVLAAVPAVELARALERWRRRRLAPWAVAAGVVALTAVFAAESIRWVRQFAAPDTRQIAAEWLALNLPPGSRLAVENSGPTYLGTLGFEVLPVELLIQEPVEWYRARRTDYLVISARDLQRHRDYLSAGPVVFEVAPSARRWGPPIRVVSLR